MMSIDTAVQTEVMLSGIGVKLIELEMLSTFDDLDTIKRDRTNDRTSATTDRTITSTRLLYSVR